MTNKAIVITGVSTGIGLGCAQAFLERGYRVYGSVRKQRDADRLRSELGENFRPILFDVTDEKKVQAAAEFVRSDLGGARLVGLINNAGIATSGPLLLQPLDEIREQFEVNVIGQLIVTRAFIDMLKAEDGHPGGRIIMMSSASGKLSAPFLGAYSGSKHALEGASAALRRELMLFGVDVVIIGPGAVASAIWDKESAQDTSRFDGTIYEKPGHAMFAFAVENGKKGESIESFGRTVATIFEKKNPKARYALVKDRLQRWILPRALPPRALDRILGKKLGLARKPAN